MKFLKFQLNIYYMKISDLIKTNLWYVYVTVHCAPDASIVLSILCMHKLDCVYTYVLVVCDMVSRIITVKLLDTDCITIPLTAIREMVCHYLCLKFKGL